MKGKRVVVGSGYRKFPVGSAVLVEDKTGKTLKVTVRRHGHDSMGLYTEVETGSGERLRFHRSQLKEAP
jgi:hypothetical protein